MDTFKVTRTWYIEADKAVEAIEKTSRYEHDEVQAKKMSGPRVLDLSEEDE